MHEIVTLQIGQQANYLGSHFWNAQESYFTYPGQGESPVNHDVHFRPGIAVDGSDTYMPRTIIYDFKGNFGTMKRLNELYEVFGEAGERCDAWTGSTVTHVQPPVPQNAYVESLNRGLEPPLLTTESVRFWSDYSRVFYHPKSIVQIHETDLDPGDRSFDQWHHGEVLFSSLDKEDDPFDRDVRSFVEECDKMQGFQVMTSVGDSWGGFSARYMDRLRDEFQKLPIWVWAIGGRQRNTGARQGLLEVNEAHALYEISPQSSIYVPMTDLPSKMPSSISIQQQSLWHTSALQCTAFESIMLPCRLRHYQNSASLNDLAGFLNINGNQRIAQLGFEVAETASKSLCDIFPRDYDTPAARDMPQVAKLEVLRGNVMHEDSRMHDAEKVRLFHTDLPFPLLDSFPRIYSVDLPASRAVSVRASLAISSSAATWIHSLEKAASLRLGIEKREALCNGLKEIAEVYDLGGASDEDTWDD